LGGGGIQGEVFGANKQAKGSWTIKTNKELEKLIKIKNRVKERLNLERLNS
jgi:hypothetical protein